MGLFCDDENKVQIKEEACAETYHLLPHKEQTHLERTTIFFLCKLELSFETNGLKTRIQTAIFKLQELLSMLCVFVSYNAPESLNDVLVELN